MFISILQFFLRPILYQSIKKNVRGRLYDVNNPKLGRISQTEIKLIYHSTTNQVKELIKNAKLYRFSKLGNRQNALLGIYTLAGYRSIYSIVKNKEYAIQLFGDVGWSLFLMMLKTPRFLAKLFFRNKQKQMNFMLKLFLFYPFGTPKNETFPGYQRKHWKEKNAYYTHWYQCAPLEIIKELGNADELNMFYQTWCHFDYSLAREMVPGGCFDRSTCLACSDDVCDMKWSVPDFKKTN